MHDPSGGDSKNIFVPHQPHRGSSSGSSSSNNGTTKSSESGSGGSKTGRRGFGKRRGEAGGSDDGGSERGGGDVGAKTGGFVVLNEADFVTIFEARDAKKVMPPPGDSIFCQGGRSFLSSVATVSPRHEPRLCTSSSLWK